jgi:hypothetical protein
MRLKDVFLEAVFEGEDVIDFSDGDENFKATLNRMSNSVVFAPAENYPQADPQVTKNTKIETVITMLKQKFKVLSVKNLEDEGDSDGSADDPTLRRVYEVKLSPTVDINLVRDYLVEISDAGVI